MDFLLIFGPILSPIGQLLPEEGAYVTGLVFMSSVLHDKEPEGAVKKYKSFLHSPFFCFAYRFK